MVKMLVSSWFLALPCIMKHKIQQVPQTLHPRLHLHQHTNQISVHIRSLGSVAVFRRASAYTPDAVFMVTGSYWPALHKPLSLVTITQ